MNSGDENILKLSEDQINACIGQSLSIDDVPLDLDREMFDDDTSDNNAPDLDSWNELKFVKTVYDPEKVEVNDDVSTFDGWAMPATPLSTEVNVSSNVSMKFVDCEGMLFLKQ